MVIALKGENKTKKKKRKKRNLTHVPPLFFFFFFFSYLMYLRSPSVETEVVTGDFAVWQPLKRTQEGRANTNEDTGARFLPLRAVFM